MFAVVLPIVITPFEDVPAVCPLLIRIAPVALLPVEVPETIERAPLAPAVALPDWRLMLPDAADDEVPLDIVTAPDAAAELPEVMEMRPLVPDVTVLPDRILTEPELAAVAMPDCSVTNPVAVPESAAPVIRFNAPDKPVPLPAPVVRDIAPPVPFVDAAAPAAAIIAPPLPVAPAPLAPPVSDNAPPAPVPAPAPLVIDIAPPAALVAAPAAPLIVSAAPAVSAVVLSVIWIV